MKIYTVQLLNTKNYFLYVPDILATRQYPVLPFEKCIFMSKIVDIGLNNLNVWN